MPLLPAGILVSKINRFNIVMNTVDMLKIYPFNLTRHGEMQAALTVALSLVFSPIIIFQF